MYISKIEITNIRCFEHLTIDLERDGDLRMWLTVLGDNAVGKSTVLKCVAMGLCDESSAAALMKEEPGDFIRKPNLNGKISITLKDNVKEKGLTIDTVFLKLSKESPEILRQEVPEKLEPWKDIFLCAYGGCAANAGGDTYEHYKPLEAVYNLFKTASDLQNTEAIMYKQSEDDRNWLSKRLQEILNLENYSEIEYNKKGMFVSGPWGNSRINELSDGYRKVIQIIVDFFGWQVVANRLVSNNDNISGIILIDELETYLHPKWQRYIVDGIRKFLPNVQVFVSTHSPLVALGTSDLTSAFILELDLEPNNKNRVCDNLVDSAIYKGYTVDQILTSSPFNIPIARSGIIGDKLIKFRELFVINNRSSSQEKEFQKLKLEIDSEIPEAGEQEADRKLQRELKDLLKNINDDI